MATAQGSAYRSNGAAAYDVYRWQDNTAQRQTERRQLPEERSVPQEQVRPRAKMAIAPFTVLGIITAACLMVLVIFGYVQLYEATSRVSKLETQLQQLQEDQMLLRSKYETNVDLAAAEAYAAEAVLSRPLEEQIIYLNLSGVDRTQIYHQEQTNVASEIIQAMRESVMELIAYLRPASA